MGGTIKFDYYYGIEAEQFSFYRVPRLLIKDERFKGLSSDAKLLYGLMLDRMALSMKNGWLDDENRAYIIYTVDSIMEDLGCGKDKAIKVLAELDTNKGIGLVERIRRGLGKPDIIYVKNFVIPEENDEQPDKQGGDKGAFTEEQGFPGNAVVDVTFKVTEENALAIIYNAKADKTTTFNMTNHSYFNLNGHASGSVYTHTLQINAEHYTPVKDSKAIPTGEIAPVEGTPFDFTEAKPIGRDIEANDTQLHYGSGYDHNFAIDKTAPGVEKVATAYSPESGIQMEVYTDCVGIQLYTANFIVGQEGKGGVKYNNRDAFCLETQFYPNSINETNFSTPVTKAGDTYHTETDYKFSVR